MPPRKSGRGVKRGAAEISAEGTSLSDGDCYSFTPEDLSDITVHYQSKSYHLHKYVLVTKSKFFKAALLTAKSDDACSLPDCVSRGDSHRCITLDGNQIGGVSISTDDLLTFFHHMYAAADPNGDWKKLIDEEHEPAAPSHWPREYYMALVRSSNPTNDTASLDFYCFDGIRRYDMTGASCSIGVDATKLSSHPIGTFVRSPEYVDHPNLHLSDYFQADMMMKQYEAQAALAINQLTSKLETAITVWWILQIADRYGWQEVRAACISICAKVPKLVAPWKDFARKLKLETVLEIFEASKASGS